MHEPSEEPVAPLVFGHPETHLTGHLLLHCPMCGRTKTIGFTEKDQPSIRLKLPCPDCMPLVVGDEDDDDEDDEY